MSRPRRNELWIQCEISILPDAFNVVQKLGPVRDARNEARARGIRPQERIKQSLDEEARRNRGARSGYDPLQGGEAPLSGLEGPSKRLHIIEVLEDAIREIV